MPTLRQMWFVDHSPGRGGIILPTIKVGSPGGKFYAEMQITAASLSGLGWGVVFGIAGTGLVLRTPVGVDGFDNSSSIVSMKNGSFFNVSNASTQALGWGYPSRIFSAAMTIVVGDWFGMAIDTINSQWWIRNATRAPTIWFGASGGGTPNPVGAVQPIDFGAASGTSPIAGNIYLLGGVSQQGNTNVSKGILTLNAGASAFVAAAPTGYIAYDALALWNGADQATEISLTGSNLIVSNTAQIIGANQPYAMVRSTKSKRRTVA